MPIERTTLCNLIPHTGAMCLLDRIEEWDDDVIVCISQSHRAPENPLRRNGRLSALHVFEYAAQAAAAHGALLTGVRDAEPRVFAALRDAYLSHAYLDAIEAPLEIISTRLLVDGGNAVYSTEIRGGGSTIARARLFLMVARPLSNEA